MPSNFRGAGVLFYDKANRRVLLYRRDNNPMILFPNCLDILGGHAEDGETPEDTVVREIAEELDDCRTGRPFALTGHRLFKSVTGPEGITDVIFCREVDFQIADIRLKEGQELVWLNEDDVQTADLAFSYTPVVADFFGALRSGPG